MASCLKELENFNSSLFMIRDRDHVTSSVTQNALDRLDFYYKNLLSEELHFIESVNDNCTKDSSNNSIRHGMISLGQLSTNAIADCYSSMSFLSRQKHLH